jgi:hypothetical protein
MLLFIAFVLCLMEEPGWAALFLFVYWLVGD